MGKIFIFSRVIFLAALMLLLSTGAYADVTGCWDVSGNGSIKIKAGRFGKVTQSINSDETFCFYSDHSFKDGSNIKGTWKQNGNSFTTTYNKKQIISLFKKVFKRLAPKGAKISLTIKKAQITGTESQDNISGKWYISGKGYVSYKGQKASLSFTANLNYDSYNKRSAFSAYDSEQSGNDKDALNNVAEQIATSLNLVN